MNNSSFSTKVGWYIIFSHFLFTIGVQAQIDINTYSDGYISVNSYNGVTASNWTTVQVNLNGNSNLENWTLTARVSSPIRNSEGKTFPFDKIAMRINHIEGSIQGVTPSITSIGADPNPIIMQLSDVNLIQNSPLKLKTPAGTYNQIKIVYDIIIQGGAYLQELKSWQSYPFHCVITLKNAAGGIVHQGTINNYNLQIVPSDNPPIENTYSIETSINSRNSFLEFNTLADYVNGVKVQYNNALKVISSTPYSIQVRSTSNQLTASRSELPISVIQLSLIDSKTSGTLGNLELSSYYQTLYQSPAAAKQARYFDLKYWTKARDQRLLEVKPDTYSTTLIYTLTPQ
ncbi:hypothetical protein [Flavobacterium sp. HSC-61S13]|uniref:hypothetical protein n=1 Tax=Flavobacterium sp. HSC-61S13 TaxID=2910963 RepID=UPI00209C778A|nr:hypothetical protein [Flavobacterium sp. HSC-61S13]MCP1994754.1 hypothetical protein [Flavobacterium sp. HSC-61S13]